MGGTRGARCVLDARRADFLRDVGLLVALGVDALWPGALPIVPYLRWTALAVPAATALLTLIGYANARRVAAVRSVDIPIAMLPPSLRGFTIVQITDFIRPDDRPRLCRSDRRRVNGLEPICRFTGDLVDGSVSHLRGIRSRWPDYVAPWHLFRYRQSRVLLRRDAWIDEFRRLGLNVLLNEHVVLITMARACVAGVTDSPAIT